MRRDRKQHRQAQGRRKEGAASRRGDIGALSSSLGDGRRCSSRVSAAVFVTAVADRGLYGHRKPGRYHLDDDAVESSSCAYGACAAGDWCAGQSGPAQRVQQLSPDVLGGHRGGEAADQQGAVARSRRFPLRARGAIGADDCIPARPFNGDPMRTSGSRCRAAPRTAFYFFRGFQARLPGPFSLLWSPGRLPGPFLTFLWVQGGSPDRCHFCGSRAAPGPFSLFVRCREAPEPFALFIGYGAAPEPFYFCSLRGGPRTRLHFAMDPEAPAGSGGGSGSPGCTRWNRAGSRRGGGGARALAAAGFWRAARLFTAASCAARAVASVAPSRSSRARAWFRVEQAGEQLPRGRHRKR